MLCCAVLRMCMREDGLSCLGSLQEVGYLRICMCLDSSDTAEGRDR